mmetsp:Transcript_8910/g.24691  ORF Transcript_8910/g.24691 Transcript_8910/m.24691 type:complete len:240 (-) Transcript_8910:49-768(-)
MTVLFAKKTIQMIEPYKTNESFQSTIDVHYDEMSPCAAKAVSPSMMQRNEVSINRKRVSFDESANTFIGRTTSRTFVSDSKPFRLETCWYTPQEIQRFEDSQEGSIQFLLEEQKFGSLCTMYSLLSELYSLAKKGTMVEDQTFLELEEKLVKSYADSGMMWGMESKAIFDIKKKSRQSQERLRSEMREIQMEGEFWDDDDDQEEQAANICQASLHCTQTARAFAQLLGRVQQSCVTAMS